MCISENKHMEVGSFDPSNLTEDFLAFPRNTISNTLRESKCIPGKVVCTHLLTYCEDIKAAEHDPFFIFTLSN